MWYFILSSEKPHDRFPPAFVGFPFPLASLPWFGRHIVEAQFLSVLGQFQPLQASGYPLRAQFLIPLPYTHRVWSGRELRENQEEFTKQREKIRSQVLCNLGAGGGIWRHYLANPPPRLPETLGTPHLIPGHRCSCNKWWFFHLAAARQPSGSAPYGHKAQGLAWREQGKGWVSATDFSSEEGQGHSTISTAPA